MKKARYWSIIMVLVLLLNLAAFSSTFCDAYSDHVYGVIADTVGKMTAGIPVALGELLMYAAAFFVVLAVLLCAGRFVFRKKQGYRTFFTRYWKCMRFFVALVLLVYTLNWVIPFRSSVLGKSEHKQTEYSTERLRALRNYIVEHLNEACMQVERDETGHIIYKETINGDVEDAMRGISDEYPRLKGYYPPMKAALCSDVLDWMWIGGFTYPYTMEVTYNKYTSGLYYPTLYSHELAHHKGYYKENEANFLSYLACANSSEPLLRYSAYKTMYYYIDSEYYDSLVSTDADESLFEEYDQIAVSEQVWADENDEVEEVTEAYEEDTHPMETFSETAAEAADVGWETQDEILEENNYDGVVTLMLEYYDGILYD